MPDTPSIAVIMPVRNGMPWIPESIESIRRQAYQPLEMVIADDGSTDDTVDFVRGLGSFCTQLLKLEGVGPAAARNAALQATTSEFVAFLDADDLWAEGTLHALARALLDDPPAGFAQGLIRNFHASSNGGTNVDIDCFTLPYRFLNLGACLWRRTLFQSIGLLDAALTLCEDLDFMMRCWENDIPKAHVDRVALYYRRHEGNMTRGLSGAGLGTVKAFQRRLERIRRGEFDSAAPRRFDERKYLGRPPLDQDGRQRLRP